MAAHLKIGATNGMECPHVYTRSLLSEVSVTVALFTERLDMGNMEMPYSCYRIISYSHEWRRLGWKHLKKTSDILLVLESILESQISPCEVFGLVCESGAYSYLSFEGLCNKLLCMVKGDELANCPPTHTHHRNSFWDIDTESAVRSSLTCHFHLKGAALISMYFLLVYTQSY